jgi:GT2 family glycosyltransferase
VKITALLVTHNGARWLPAVLSGLEQSTVLPHDILAVDTGSDDESAALVEQALGTPVQAMPADTSYAAAVRAALAIRPAEPDEWVWLLHDDANPTPECLQTLVEAAEHAPEGVAILGPKLREWPSLRRLLEVGVTLSGTGKRETGLETGEYDQGQHDETHEVLAVNTAGMLVRRDVLEQVSFDPQLKIFGNDLDFGWRAARQGHRTMVVPDAVMFHAEAAHRGQRTGKFTKRPRRDERAAAVYMLLVNGPAWAMPLRGIRLLLGGLLRALGFLLVRAPGEARDEVAGLARVFTAPQRIIRGRSGRRGRATVPRSQVRPLLAPGWLPYRHGLDFVSDVAVAIGHTARGAAARRTDRPVDEVSYASLVLRSPLVWTFVGGLLLALVAGRQVLTGAPLQGGALLPAPEHVTHWWQTWAASWHWLGTGSNAVAPAYLLPMSVAGTLLFGHPGWVVWWLFLLGVPLGMVGAFRLLRRVTSGRWAPPWGALTYALIPVLSGAVSQGRLGTVAGAIIAPWVATSALGLADPDPDRRSRAVWRTTLGTGLLVAFVPPAFVLVALLVLTARWWTPVRLSAREAATLVVVPLLLVLPWVAGTLADPGAWLVEAGRAASVPVNPGFLDLLLGRSGGPGAAPGWLSVGLPLAGLIALVRPDTRARVARVWVVIVTAALLLGLSSLVVVHLPGVVVGFRPWTGFMLVVIQGGFVVAAAIAAAGSFAVVSSAGFTWRQPIAAVAFGTALLAPLLGGFWWLGHGSQGPLHRAAPAQLPTYMSELAAGRNTSAVLVLKGGNGNRPIVYQVLRSGELRLGDDGVVALTAPDPKVTSLVQETLSSQDNGQASRLAGYGITYVYAPAPVSPTVSGALDAAGGFSGASHPDENARAWRIVPAPTLDAIDRQPALLRPALLAVQLLALLAVIVLAVPSRRQQQ